MYIRELNQKIGRKKTKGVHKSAKKNHKLFEMISKGYGDGAKAVVIFCVAALVWLSVVTYSQQDVPLLSSSVSRNNWAGMLGAVVSGFLCNLIGWWSSFLLPIIIFKWGLEKFRASPKRIIVKALGMIILVVSFSTLLALTVSGEESVSCDKYGGIIGLLLADTARKYFNFFGYIVAPVLMIGGFTLASEFTYKRLWEVLALIYGSIASFLNNAYGAILSVFVSSREKPKWKNEQKEYINEKRSKWKDRMKDAAPKITIKPAMAETAKTTIKEAQKDVKNDDDYDTIDDTEDMETEIKKPETARKPKVKNHDDDVEIIVGGDLAEEPEEELEGQPAEEEHDEEGVPEEKDEETEKSAKIIDFKKKREEIDAFIGDAEDEKIKKMLDNNGPDEGVEYELPTIEMLADKLQVDDVGKIEEDIKNTSHMLEETLRDFQIDAKVVSVNRGPVVTMYELQLAPGTKVSNISSRSSDIELALAAPTIRIQAPIPGKSAVGIEVPNRVSASVTLKEIIGSEVYQKNSSKLKIALGKDIVGIPIVADLSGMPHVLIAGSTGSGKSVCINTVICSILFNSKPDEVKMLIIDPKMVELKAYHNIPNLVADVVTDAKKASFALRNVVDEMELRYKVLAKIGARDIKSFNKMIEEGRVAPEYSKVRKLPYIVVIVDELADMMMVSANDCEESITRLAQMARAVGIHLVLATQRPSVDVITGLIKANFPTRIAFQVASKIDSRTILDMIGAEKLLGKGDMLYLPAGKPKPIRLQGCFVSDQEIENIVTFIKNQDHPSYHKNVIETKEDSVEFSWNLEDEKLYKKALKAVVENKRASKTFLKGLLRVSDGKADRILNRMEQEGFVGPHQGSKEREILITVEDLIKQNALNMNEGQENTEQ